MFTKVMNKISNTLQQQKPSVIPKNSVSTMDPQGQLYSIQSHTLLSLP